MFSPDTVTLLKQRVSDFSSPSEDSPPIFEQQRVYNGYIGDFKKYKDLMAKVEDDYDSEESENEIISIEDTYNEVGQYKTHNSPKPDHMTVIHEEEVEDSVLHSNFNSQVMVNIS